MAEGCEHHSLADAIWGYTFEYEEIVGSPFEVGALRMAKDAVWASASTSGNAVVSSFEVRIVERQFGRKLCVILVWMI